MNRIRLLVMKIILDSVKDFVSLASSWVDSAFRRTLSPTALLLCGLLTFTGAVSQGALSASSQPVLQVQPTLEMLTLTTPVAVAAMPSASPKSGIPTRSYSQLPTEAQTTINLIYQGGPFPYDRDGITFGNREGLLPKQSYGYYREYTVDTPGASNRGARRIVSGQNGELYYTADHYASFVRVQFE